MNRSRKSRLWCIGSGASSVEYDSLASGSVFVTSCSDNSTLGETSGIPIFCRTVNFVHDRSNWIGWVST
ncbi:hypothetical protein V8E54_010175 [Elaphomyces granulatus]